MASPTELHFEGRGSSRRWILGAAIIVITLLAMFAKATLPSQRSEFVGKWKNLHLANSFYEFRADGTYAAVLSEDGVSGSIKPPLAKYEGKWKAGHNLLYLTHTSIKLLGMAKDQKRFDASVKERLGQQIKFDIEWPSTDQWMVKYQSDKTFQKVR
jgi:hypothetical protein